MKLNVCDIHRKEGTLVEATKFQSFKGHPELRIDACDDHNKTLPDDKIEYVKLAYELRGLSMTDARVREMYPALK